LDVDGRTKAEFEELERPGAPGKKGKRRKTICLERGALQGREWRVENYISQQGDRKKGGMKGKRDGPASKEEGKTVGL